MGLLHDVTTAAKFVPGVGPIVVGASQLGNVNDDVVKDSKQQVHLSSILATGGFNPSGAGPKGSGMNELQAATAVGMAESQGNPNAYNHLPCSAHGDHAVGLMQVCTVNAGVAGSPSDRKEFETWLKNPDNNARAAKAILDSQGWGAWATVTSGAYRRYAGKDPVVTITDKGTLTGAVSGGVSAAAAAVASPFAFVGDLIKALFDPSTYLRLGKGLLGGILLILGTAALVFMAANKVSGGKVGAAAKDAAMVAAVA